MLLGYSARIRNKEYGFALIIILSLTAFLTFLLLSMATFVRVDTSVVETRNYQKLARDNAIYAVRLALSEIQRHAGPDQRVTARADILDENIANPFWTGIWNVDSTSSGYGDVTWLVSGMNPNPRLAMEDEVILLGDGSSSEIIALPREPIFITPFERQDKSSLIRQGHYAYWVSDEGIKASIAKIDHTQVEINYRNDIERDLMRQLSPQKIGGEVFYPDLSPLSLDYDSVNSNLHKIYSRSQLPLISGLFGNEKSAANAIAHQHFHDLTTVAHGVIANTLSGKDAGLKKDLSLYPSLLGPGFEAYLDYPSYMAGMNDKAETSLPTRHYNITPFDSTFTQPGQIQHTIAPILTESLFQINIRSNEKSPEIRVRLRSLFELWNPYTSEILLGPSNAGELEMAVTGLPTLLVVDSNGGTASIDLQSFLGDTSQPDSPFIIRLPFPAEEHWLPGRIFNWAGAPIANFDSRRWNLNAITIGGVNGLETGKMALEPIRSKTSNDTRFKITSAELTSLNLKLYLAVPGKEKALLADYRDVQFSEIDVAPYKHWQKTMNFGFHFRLKEPIDSHVHPEHRRGQWLVDHDPRDPQLNASAFTSVHGVLPAEPELFGGANVKTSAPSHIFDRRSGNNFRHPYEDIPIFELPRLDAYSLGSLQRLFIVGERPFSIGNRWSSESWRSIFDRYFLSALPRNGDPAVYDPRLPLPNPWLVFHHSLPTVSLGMEDILTSGNESARHFFIQGAFNINSTSVSAWEAVLSSLKIKDWRYIDVDNKKGTPQTVSTVDLMTSFARFSQSAQETFEAPDVKQDPYEPGPTVFPTKLYRRGLRTLSKDEIDIMAQGIVDRLRINAADGIPFRSLGEFIGPLSGEDPESMSVIEAAIADIDNINLWQADGEVVEIDKFSSYDLTSADILTAIAPFISVRSDTFLVRAYGDVINPLVRDNKGLPVTEGRAWCEAIVQRLPELLNTDDNIFSPSPYGFGRRFYILSFRWLDTLDI